MGTFKYSSAPQIVLSQAAVATGEAVRFKEFAEAVDARPTRTEMQAAIDGATHDPVTAPAVNQTLDLDIGGDQVLTGEVLIPDDVAYQAAATGKTQIVSHAVVADDDVQLYDSIASQNFEKVTITSIVRRLIGGPGSIASGVDGTDYFLDAYSGIVTIAEGSNLITSAGQEVLITFNVAQIDTGAALAPSADGLLVDLGTARNQAAKGDHQHANDHRAAEGADTATARTTISQYQEVEVDVILAAGGGLTDTGGAGVAVDYNLVSPVGHSHATVTQFAPGFMSPAQLAQLNALNDGSPVTSVLDSTTIEIEKTGGQISASVIVGVGLKVGLTGLEVDFDEVGDRATQDDHEERIATGEADIAALQAALALKADQDDVDAALAGKSDVGHTHVIGDVTGLQAALDNKYSPENPPDENMTAADKERFDLSFVGGFNDTASCILVDRDDIYIGGDFTALGNVPVKRMAKIGKDGLADPRFDTGYGFNHEVTMMRKLTDGGILLSGGSQKISLNSGSSAWLHKVDEFGQPVAGFNSPAQIAATGSDAVLAIETLSDRFAAVSWQTMRMMDLDGATMYARNAEVNLHSLARYGENLIVASRQGTRYNGTLNPSGIKVIDETGQISADWIAQAGIGAAANASYLVVSPDGSRIFAGNSIASANGGGANRAWKGGSGTKHGGIYKIRTDGVEDADWSITIVLNTSTAWPIPFAVDTLGRLYFGGDIASINGTTVTPNGLYRVNSDGTSLHEFEGFNDTVRDCKLVDDNRIIVVGEFTAYGTLPVGRMVFIDSEGRAMSSLQEDACCLTGFDGEVRDIAVDGEDIYAVGDFRKYGQIDALGVAKLDVKGQHDPTFDSSLGFDGPVDYAAISNGSLIVGSIVDTIYGDEDPRNVHKIGSDGVYDSSFIPAAVIATVGSDTLQGLAVLPNGKVAVITQRTFTVLNTDGTKYFSAEGTDRFNAIAALGSKLIIASRAFTSSGRAQSYNGVASPKGLKLLNTGSPVGAGYGNIDGVWALAVNGGSGALSSVGRILASEDGNFVIAGNALANFFGVNTSWNTESLGNLLLYSEQMGNAAWTQVGSGTVITSNVSPAPSQVSLESGMSVFVTTWATDFSYSKFGRLDLATGDYTNIKTTMGSSYYSGIAVHPSTGVIYAAKRATNHLVTLDPNTGAETDIGAIGQTLQDIAFKSNGVLYAAGGTVGSGSLFTINLGSGNATLVAAFPATGPLGDSLTIQTLGFNASDVLYAVDLDNGGRLYTVNQTTAAITDIGDISQITGASKTYGGTFFGSYLYVSDDTTIYKVDVTAATAVAVTSFDTGSNGIINSMCRAGEDATSTADRVEDNTGAAQSYIYQNITITDGSDTYFFSVYVKKDSTTSRFPTFEMRMTGGSSDVDVFCSLNTSTGAVLLTGNVGGGNGSVTVDDVGDYWRVNLTASNNSSGNETLRCVIYPSYSPTFGGAASSLTGSIIVWGAQAGFDFWSSDYQMTTSAQVVPAGSSANSNRFRGLYKILKNGKADSVWASNITLSEAGHVIPFAIDAAGRVYIGGPIATIDGTSVTPWRLYRLTATGALDKVYDSFNNRVLVARLTHCERLAVGGRFTAFGSRPADRFAVVNPDGTIFDPTEGSTAPVAQDTAPDLTENPCYRDRLWIDTSSNPHMLRLYNTETETWQSICEICAVVAKQQLPPPQFTPPYGNAIITVSIAVPGYPNAIIRYTLDGSDPDVNSAIYTSPLTISDTTTVKAYATQLTFDDSDIAQADYYATGYQQLPPVEFSPSSGTAPVSGGVTLSNAVSGATILYSVDGSTPSLVYVGTPIVVVSALTIKAKATKTGYVPSIVSSAYFGEVQQLIDVHFTDSDPTTVHKTGAAALGGIDDYWNLLLTGQLSISGLKYTDGVTVSSVNLLMDSSTEGTGYGQFNRGTPIGEPIVDSGTLMEASYLVNGALRVGDFEAGVGFFWETAYASVSGGVGHGGDYAMQCAIGVGANPAVFDYYSQVLLKEAVLIPGKTYHIEFYAKMEPGVAKATINLYAGLPDGPTYGIFSINSWGPADVSNPKFLEGWDLDSDTTPGTTWTKYEGDYTIPIPAGDDAPYDPVKLFFFMLSTDTAFGAGIVYLDDVKVNLTSGVQQVPFGLRLNGIAPGIYDLLVYGRPDDTSYISRFTMSKIDVDGNTISTETKETDSGAITTTFAEGEQYVRFNNISIAEGDDVRVDILGPDPTAIISGLQLASHQAIPTLPNVIFTPIASGGSWRDGDQDLGSWMAICASEYANIQYAIYSTQAIYKSVDGGIHWTLLAGLGAGEAPVSICCSADGSKVWVFAYHTATYGRADAWYSSNSGTSWTDKKTITGTSGLLKIACSSDGSRVALAAKGYGITVSQNSGTSWTDYTDSRGWSGICISDDGQKISACEETQNVWISTNAWAAKTMRSPIGDWSAISCDSTGLILYALSNGTVFYSSDQGANWTQSAIGQSTPTSIDCSASGRYAIAGFYSDVHITENFAASWQTSTPSGILNASGVFAVQSGTYGQTGSSHSYGACDYGSGGKLWARIPSGLAIEMSLEGISQPYGILYTDDNTDPGASGSAQTYSEAVAITENNTTLKARAFKDGYLGSDMTTETFSPGTLPDLPALTCSALTGITETMLATNWFQTDLTGAFNLIYEHTAAVSGHPDAVITCTSATVVGSGVTASPVSGEPSVHISGSGQVTVNAVLKAEKTGYNPSYLTVRLDII